MGCAVYHSSHSLLCNLIIDKRSTLTWDSLCWRDPLSELSLASLSESPDVTILPIPEGLKVAAAMPGDCDGLSSALKPVCEM